MPSCGAALHFHHMGDGMVRPAVGRVQIQRAAPRILGARIVAGFLQPESVHAQQDGIARNIHRPVRQYAGNAVAQVARIGMIEVDQMAGLQRQEIVRKADIVLVRRPGRHGPFPRR